MLDEVRTAWPELSSRSHGLPQTPPALSALQVTRSAAETVFVFGEGRFPLLVLKHPHDEDTGVAREYEALRLAAAAPGVAPLPLGRLGPFYVQQGRPGLPLQVSPVRVGEAHDLPRAAAFVGLDRALERLAAATAAPATGSEAFLPELVAAQDYGLPPRVVAAVAEARRHLADLEVTVLQHEDMSAQNWLVDGDRFVGLVDWEMALPAGLPGQDAMQAAVSVFEHGVALARWSEEDVVASFRAAWGASPFFHGARRALRTTAAAAGVSAPVQDSLEVAYFARRLGRAVLRPGAQTLSAPEYAAMLTTVCVS